jgi:hypothetical protein
MRTVLDIFAQIFHNLWAHKLRSFLTMFGIAWGVVEALRVVEASLYPAIANLLFFAAISNEPFEPIRSLFQSVRH